MSAPHASRKGHHNPNSRLNEAQVESIRNLRGMGWKLQEIASYAGISKSQVVRICNNTCWRK